jgi:hypothetical protein
MLVLLNFTAHNAITNIETGVKMQKCFYQIIKLRLANKTFVTLRPYESIIYKLPM